MKFLTNCSIFRMKNMLYSKLHRQKGVNSIAFSCKTRLVCGVTPPPARQHLRYLLGSYQELTILFRPFSFTFGVVKKVSRFMMRCLGTWGQIYDSGSVIALGGKGSKVCRKMAIDVFADHFDF